MIFRHGFEVNGKWVSHSLRYEVQNNSIDLFPLFHVRCGPKEVELPVNYLFIILVLLLLYKVLPIPLGDPLGPDTFKDLNVATFGVLDHHRNVIKFTSCDHSLHFARKRLRLKEEDITRLHLR